MDDGWAKHIKAGIEDYRLQVMPMIEEGYFWAAGMQMGNSLFVLEGELRNLRYQSALSTLFIYLLGLVAHLKVLQKYCLEEEIAIDDQEERVRGFLPRVQERLELVDLIVAGLLKS